MIQKLAKSLPNLEQLESFSLNLDLVWYEFRVSNQEMQALFTSLSKLTSLKRLEIVSGADISNEGIHHMIKLLPQINNLETLRLIFKMRVCKIGDQEIILLAKSLSNLKLLRNFSLYLDASATSVTLKGVDEFRNSLKHLEYLAFYRKEIHLLHHS